MSGLIEKASVFEGSTITHTSGDTFPINRNGGTSSTDSDALFLNTHTLVFTNNNERSFFVQFFRKGYVPTGALTAAGGALLIPGGATLTISIGSASGRPGGQVPFFYYENVASGTGKLFFDQLIGSSI